MEIHIETEDTNCRDDPIMKIMVKKGKIEEEPAEIIVLSHYEDLKELKGSKHVVDVALNGAITELVESKDLKGELNEIKVIYTHGQIPSKRVLLVGLGKKEELTLDNVRQASGKAIVHIRDMGIKSFVTPLHGSDELASDIVDLAQALVEGCILGVYQFTEYKTEDLDKIKEIDEFILIEEDESKISEIQQGVKVGEIIANATCFTRDLVNYPANKGTPTFLAEKAKQISDKLGLKCKILSEKDMKKLGMGALLGVAQGSDQPAKFIILEHNADKEDLDTFVLCGKGITFDSGGISIKPAKGMEEMKTDMAGAATVLGVMKAVGELELPLRVVSLIPATENLPSGKAYKPGDILKSYSGKTIEVINTDAEGRLILADALGYAAKYKPKAVIDIATLTGACVVALGHHATGMMGTDDELMEKISQTGKSTNERVWQLPLFKEYYEQIKSDIADVKNVGGRPAGAITAAAFLSKFIEGCPWVHLDIAGTEWTEKAKPYTPKGATGVGVRLLIHFLRNISEN